MGGPLKLNKAFYFVSYESTADHKVVDRTVSVPLPAMLRGDLSRSTTAIYDPLSGNADGSGRTQFRVLPGDPNYSLCNTAANPNCLNIIPAPARRRMLVHARRCTRANRVGASRRPAPRGRD